MSFFLNPLVWLIWLTCFEDSDDDVGQLACYPYDRFLRFHPFLVGHISATQSVIPIDANPCSLHELRSELFVSTESLFAM